jgi:hypothetical protein
MGVVEDRLAKQSGESAGKRAVWNFLYVLAGLVLGALTVYFTVVR